jgi:hypothetical protein
MPAAIIYRTRAGHQQPCRHTRMVLKGAVDTLILTGAHLPRLFGYSSLAGYVTVMGTTDGAAAAEGRSR